jgi:CO/xanthine dehydrogenase FAD-binding subunit
MRAYLPAYELRAPESLPEALSMLAAAPGAWRPFAGGTDLMVQLESGALPEGQYLGLWKIGELRGIRELGDGVEIGALTTYSEILTSALLERDYPLLGHAARETGGVATQNRGTIGGNIANASPAADTPPALLVYDAELELISVRGRRRVPYDAFHLGYKKMDLAPDELIACVRLPKRAPGWREHYRKVGTRKAQAISKVCLAAALRWDGSSGAVADLRIALGSVAPTVVRARSAEGAIRGQRLGPAVIDAAVHALVQDIAPIDDIRSTARYRLNVAQRLLREWLPLSATGIRNST